MDDQLWGKKKDYNLNTHSSLFFQSKFLWVINMLLLNLQEDYKSDEAAYGENPPLIGLLVNWIFNIYPFTLLKYVKGIAVQHRTIVNNKDEYEKVDKNNKFEYFKDTELNGPLGDIIGRPYFLKPSKTQPKKKSKKKQNLILEDDLRTCDDDEAKKVNSCNWIPRMSQTSDLGLSEDRRIEKTKLKIAEFNAEWLYLYGGNGALKCPGIQCPWKVFSFSSKIE